MLGKWPKYLKLDIDNIEIVVFDLDGTLILQDSLLEQTIAIIKNNKLKSLFLLSILLFKGRISYKKIIFAVNEKFDKNATAMRNIKTNKKVLDLFNDYRSQNLKVIIATAAYYKTAIKVLEKIQVIPDVLIATKNNVNLKGKQKLAALSKIVRGKKWAYFGDSISDTPLFRDANYSYLVKNEKIEELN